MDRQRIVATYGSRTFRFDAVVQKRANELMVLGLTPFGSRAFVIRQTGTRISYEAFVSQPMPFAPEYMLIDVQRMLFPWIDASADPNGRTESMPAADGDRQATRNGETVTETWRADRLIRRTFRPVGADPARAVVIDYEGGMGRDGVPARHVTFRNGWYGYALDITTFEHRVLPGS